MNTMLDNTCFYEQKVENSIFPLEKRMSFESHTTDISMKKINSAIHTSIVKSSASIKEFKPKTKRRKKVKINPHIKAKHILSSDPANYFNMEMLGCANSRLNRYAGNQFNQMDNLLDQLQNVANDLKSDNSKDKDNNNHINALCDLLGKSLKYNPKRKTSDKLESNNNFAGFSKISRNIKKPNINLNLPRQRFVSENEIRKNSSDFSDGTDCEKWCKNNRERLVSFSPADLTQTFKFDYDYDTDENSCPHNDSPQNDRKANDITENTQSDFTFNEEPVQTFENAGLKSERNDYNFNFTNKEKNDLKVFNSPNGDQIDYIKPVEIKSKVGELENLFNMDSDHEQFIEKTTFPNYNSNANELNFQNDDFEQDGRWIEKPQNYGVLGFDSFSRPGSPLGNNRFMDFFDDEF